MSEKKIGWLILLILLLTIVGGVTYLIATKKYIPKVEGIEYLDLELVKDTALVKTGINIQNRIPLPIAIDSVYYIIVDEGDTLGIGQMTKNHRLPPLGNNVLDFRLLLDFEKYREHIKDKQGKDSIRIDVAMDIYFDLPFISPQNITLNRHITVPVAKSPAMEIRDIKVRSFNVEDGYSLLLRIDATNRDLPNLEVEDFQYNINIGDSLLIAGQVDSAFSMQEDSRLIEIPLELKTTDAIALIKKMLSGDKSWDYKATIEAQVKSEHPLFDSFRLTVEKEGNLDISQMGTGKDFLPTISRITKLDIESDEAQTRIRADIIVDNPSPFPLYIDSVSYFIRHQGKIIARGKRNLEKVLPKSGKQDLSLGLVVDKRAYQNFMKKVQGQDNVSLDMELNLVYNLPDTDKQQKITLKRNIQVPVPGQAGIQITGLEVRELDPEKGAFLGLQLKVQSSNLPDLQIRNLDYKLQLGKDILLTGQTKEPIIINGEVAEIEVPIHLTSEDVNLLVKRAISGVREWKYNLDATATLSSTNKLLGSTKLNLHFEGELELKKGMAGNQLMPKINPIDSLRLTIHYDTAWAELKLNVSNPLPVPIYIDSLALKVSHKEGIIAIAAEGINETLPAEGSNADWIKVAINYGFWHELIKRNQSQDSIALDQDITLVYRIGNLKSQRVSFTKNFLIPTPKVPATKLETVKLRGISLTKGIVLNALVQVRNANTEKLEVSDVNYNLSVENLLDACGSIARTYDIPLGQSTIEVPISLSIGEAFRAFIAQLTGNSKERNLYLNGSATIKTASPLLKSTYIEFEKWEKTTLFKKKQENQNQTAN